MKKSVKNSDSTTPVDGSRESGKKRAVKTAASPKAATGRKRSVKVAVETNSVAEDSSKESVSSVKSEGKSPRRTRAKAETAAAEIVPEKRKTRKVSAKSIKAKTKLDDLAEHANPEEKAGARKSVKQSTVRTASDVDSAVKKSGVKKPAAKRKNAQASNPENAGLLFDINPVEKQDSPVVDAVSSKTSGSQVAFDLDALYARIAEVTLSEKELARRSAEETAKKRSRGYGVESVYPGKLPHWEPGWLIVQGARQHNLKSIDVPFPLSAFTVVTGVSGSGKSSLVEDVLFTTLSRALNRSPLPITCCEGIWGVEQIKNVVHVDQSPIGQTPTSNPATYTGLFDMIRSLYAQLPEAKVRGYSARQFSFNVPGGRCEKCEGTGLIKVEMHFLADVWITCDACGGKRYDAGTLQVKYRGKSISDALETTCGDALTLFEEIPGIRRILRTLCDVGLDYLPLGQSATTLSGGEAQRVKLAAELSRVDTGRTFYVLDEPTTGLHFDDVKKLLDVLHRLVDLGNTVVVVEHNLDVIKNADWILEIGPEAGLNGGNLVFAGTPEQLLEYTAKRNSSSELQATTPRSHTGEALFPVFEHGCFYERPVLDVERYWASVKAATDESSSLGDTANSEFALSPWEMDGRRWHMELRTSRSGSACHWDSRILGSVVDRLTESSALLTANWGSRTIVEVGAENKPGAWFLRATTSDEWLLKLRFRTAKNSFNRDLLTRKLALKPLNEMDEIPLYGAQPRARVETVGAWQEIELRAFSFDEIDQPEFWNFLDFAAERFLQQIAQIKENEPDLTPWKSKGREWHFSFLGLYGKSQRLTWNLELLGRIADVVQNTNPLGFADWYQKISVPFKTPKSDFAWAQIFTKNTDFICVQVNVEKKSFTQADIAGLGFEPELEQSSSRGDVVYLRYRSDADYDEAKLQSFLKKAFEVRTQG